MAAGRFAMTAVVRDIVAILTSYICSGHAVRFHPQALLEEAQKCHDEGNAAFRSHQYSKAQEKYEVALSVVRELYESFGWDPYIMTIIVEKDQKLLCNLSKVHRLLGHVMAAVEVGKSCVEKYPDHAKVGCESRTC